MSDRNIVEVIESMLVYIPDESCVFRRQLATLRDVAKYTAPEKMGLLWSALSESINENIEHPFPADAPDWQREVVTILMQKPPKVASPNLIDFDKYRDLDGLGIDFRALIADRFPHFNRSKMTEFILADLEIGPPTTSRQVATMIILHIKLAIAMETAIDAITSKINELVGQLNK